MMHRFDWLSPPCLFAALTACACPAAAEAAQREPVELDRIEVRNGRRTPAAGLRITQERDRLRNVAGGSNLIELDPVGRRASLRDALDYQPGIIVQDFFGGLDQPRLNIRGSGIQSNPVSRGVQLLQDGLPLNEADGSFVIGLIELRNAAFISARRGANAVTPAATTLGGEIDLHSQTGADAGGQWHAEAGSFGRHAGYVAYGQSEAAHDWRASVSADAYQGYRHHSDGRRRSFQYNFGWHPGDQFRNRTWLSWTELFFHIPSVVPKQRVYSDPRGVLGDQATPQDRLLNVYRRDPRRATRQWRIANRTEWSNGAKQQTLGLWWQTVDDLFNNTTVHNVSDGATGGLQYDWLHPREHWDYRLAAAYTGGEITRDFYANNPLNGTRLQRFGHYSLQASSLDLMASVEWRPAISWQLQAGTRWSQVQRDARDRSTGIRLNQDYAHGSPRLGVIWQRNAQWRLFGNLSRSQEVPSWWEIVNAEVSPAQPARARSFLQRLRVQRADTLELGGDGLLEGAKSTTRWSLALYRSRVTDELMAMVDAYGNRVGTYNYSAGTRHQGVEAGLSGQVDASPGHLLSYRLAWTYSDFRFLGGAYSGNQIAGVPRQLISAEVMWSGASGWRAGPSLRWLPQGTPTDHANTRAVYQDAYALLGFRLEYAPGDRPWSWFLMGDNLTDRRYASSYSIRHQATAAQPGFLPGLGRNASVGFSWRF